MVHPSMDVLSWLRKELEAADGELLRERVQTRAEVLMSAEGSAHCHARNGYRTRRWDTRVGTIDLAIPRCAGAVTTPTGSWSRGGPNGPWSPWWLSAPWPASPRAGWMISSGPWVSKGSPNPRSQLWPTRPSGTGRSPAAPLPASGWLR